MAISNAALDILTFKVLEHFKKAMYSQHFQAIENQANAGNIDPVAIAEVLNKLAYTKMQAYSAGLYKFKCPPVCTTRWQDQDWINYIDAYGGWTVEVQ